jgi:hypothetical protein
MMERKERYRYKIRRMTGGIREGGQYGKGWI